VAIARLQKTLEGGRRRGVREKEGGSAAYKIVIRRQGGRRKEGSREKRLGG
jgi:hypothetical protein